MNKARDGVRRAMALKVRVARFQLWTAGAAQIPLRMLYADPERIKSVAKVVVR